MNYMPAMPKDYPQHPCEECRAAVVQLLAELDESRRVEKQHRLRLMLLERSVKKLHRQAHQRVGSISSRDQPD